MERKTGTINQLEVGMNIPILEHNCRLGGVLGVVVELGKSGGPPVVKCLTCEKTGMIPDYKLINSGEFPPQS